MLNLHFLWIGFANLFDVLALNANFPHLHYVCINQDVPKSPVLQDGSRELSKLVKVKLSNLAHKYSGVCLCS